MKVFLQFFPNKFESIHIMYLLFSYNIGAVVTSTDTQTLGGAVKITSSSQNVPSASATTIVSIANTYTAAKILVLTKTLDDQYEYDELNLISDGTTVDVVEYGELSSINQEGLGLVDIVDSEHIMHILTAAISRLILPQMYLSLLLLIRSLLVSQV